MQSLVVILPCYNPPNSWDKSFSQNYSVLSQRLPEFQLLFLVVNDGSSDASVITTLNKFTADYPNFRFLSYSENQGKGYALRYGVSQVNADYYLVTDIDFPYTVESMLAIVTTLTQRANVAVGFRDDGYYAATPLPRKVLSKMFRLALKFVGISITDTQCGLKGFDNQGKNIFLQTKTNRFLFDFEFVKLASSAKNVTIKPVAVFLRPGVQFTSIPFAVILKEFKNFIKILFGL